MEVLKFKLSGKTAFFKKPDFNSIIYYSYENIHKVALMGIFGAIIGYEGYNQQGDKTFPQFYEKLKDIKVGIVPLNEGGVFNKKVQVFNNSVGYASFEQGGNLIIKEQWLENPAWEIYLLIDDEESEKIKDLIIKSKTNFTPYLGKNDHIANITQVELLVAKRSESTLIDSLCLEENIKEYLEEDFDIFEFKNTFKYKESLPIALDKYINQYQFKSFIYTNNEVILTDYKNLFTVKEKNILFF